MAILYVWSGAAGTASGANWANAKLTLTAAFTTEVAGDTLFVAHDHAESTAAAITLTSSGTFALPTKVICVNRAGSVPPVSADRRTTATVTTTGASNIIIGGGPAHYDGIIFNCGTGAGVPLLIVSNVNSSWCRFDNCSLRLNVTSTTSVISLNGQSGVGSNSMVELNNTTVSFANVSQTVAMAQVVKWRDTPSAVLGTIPTVLLSLIVPTAGRGLWLECIGVDFSALGSGKTILAGSSTHQGGTCRFIDCKLDAAVTKASVPIGPGTAKIDFIRCGAAAVNYAFHHQGYTGALTEETTIVRTGGASDGATPLSWGVVTTANCTYSLPYECPPIAVWNDTTGSAVTATVEGIWGGGAVPLNSECLLEVTYLGDASSPMGSFVHDGPVDLLTTATNQTSSSETWGGSTTAFKMSVTFTPQQKGWIYARVKCAKASSTFYIDPLVKLS